ncbi:periplasmic glycine betaine/choline-binding (lipo)protein of an ABC-type transport system (osmoprotectant binding protein) [Pleurocapsa sp. PCC 7327]|uniref:glycine betaine ABC transporter substrate-binding protein n=1 Tax=Pleurocapsa sp. PCC 7327 TaxID=118163 RepID=UPI00029FD57B|nr:glycine betaine ABC transporter substrate-binding protein [Pleurocapsa sp. PCC 7327]AFY78448.1 periplasmic glycine betaine/choline-binding (lipo)protein of an ABC-type transport system (osmoprotectant binding protein) [Pleurocapsa sp. PCC 7327]
MGNLFPEIWLRTGEHLILVAIAMTAAIAIGIPLGILITRQPKLAKPILAIANAIQTIPSLAIFGFLITVPFLGGIGKTPAIVALSLYTLLPLIRNTYTGITSIDPAIREAARAMGMTDRQMLVRVEIPLALGTILTGVRVATVICVGIATIAAAIGGGGLGVFIFQGIATVNNQLILAGAIPSATIAIIADGAIGWLESQLKQPGKRKRLVVGLSVGTAILLGLSLWAIASQQPLALTTEGTIVIGSKNFTEQVILGEILAQEIEVKTDLNVDRRFNLGGTFICHEAVKAGKIDGYVEYTGTAFTTILKKQPISDPKEVFRQVKQAYQEKFQLEVFPSLGFENAFAIVIRQEDADRYNLKTISEAAKYTPQWKAGFGYEFFERQDGYPGLSKTYGLKFAQTPQAMELGLVYKALSKKQVDLVAGNSTDGVIPVLNLVTLEDDKRYFPPYEAVPIFNQKTLEKYPQLRTVINGLVGKISASEMQQLNYQVDNQERSFKEVVQVFLKSREL